MKKLDSTISEDASEGPKEDSASTHDEHKHTHTKRRISTTSHHSNRTTASSECYSVTSSGNTITNTANFATRNMNTKTDMNSGEYDRQLKYLNMQNNAYLKTGFSDSRSAAYYGWIPGLNSMRMPALIYPHSFMGFAPTVAWMKTNGNASGQVANIEKVDRWKEDLSRKNTDYPSSEVSQTDSLPSVCTANNSDEDEGLVLEERETVKRRRHKDSDKLQTHAKKAQPERSSVIQENMQFIQAKPSVTIAHDDLPQDEQTLDEQERQAKRGRASTRKIEKTEQYWHRRQKNNVSAKKSRDARRQREALTNQRSSMLETENLRLRAELATVRVENTRLEQELKSFKKT